MEDYKLCIQYKNGKYEVTDWMTESKARKKFENLKKKRLEKEVLWCELVYSSLEDEDEEIVIDDFESQVIDLGICKLLV